MGEMGAGLQESQCRWYQVGTSGNPTADTFTFVQNTSLQVSIWIHLFLLHS